MHSSEPSPTPPVQGAELLHQLGRMIVRGRSPAPAPDLHTRLLQAKLRAAQPSTSKQVQSQPKSETHEPGPMIEAELNDHIHALWTDNIPICIDVLLAPDCKECYTRINIEDKTTKCEQQCLLLERWTMSVLIKKTPETPATIPSQWLLNAVRSQLHFSQLSAWITRLKDMTQNKTEEERDPNERRRKLSREQCNIKKLEANCDEKDLPCGLMQRNLNIVYSIKIPGESFTWAEFSRTPNDHTFPVTDIGNNMYLKVILQSLPRRDDIPILKCFCHLPKRRASKEFPPITVQDELILRMNDLNLGPPESRPLGYCKGSNFSPDLGVINSNIGISSGVSRKLSTLGSSEYIYSRASTPERQLDRDTNQTSPAKESNHSPSYKCTATGSNAPDYLLDDRMHTLCSENGKHKCSCDDESDNGNNRRSSTSFKVEPKKQIDERRLKEIAKYKRRLRKESKLRKYRESGASDSATSEGDSTNEHGTSKRDKCKDEPHTSIPILQASRFDRFRAIGCYRNQTYLTLPASRIETRSPFVTEPISITPTDYRKSISVSTQTDEPICACGSTMEYQCEGCKRGMVRSDGNYNLASAVNQSQKLLDALTKTGTNADKRRDADVSDAANKKHKCDKPSDNIICDESSSNIGNNFNMNDAPVTTGVRKYPDDGIEVTNIIKRPKLKRIFPIVDRIEKIVNERCNNNDNDSSNDMQVLLLKDDDTVFSNMKRVENVSPRKNTSSISEEEYVFYEKCDYGSFDRCDVESPTITAEGFSFPDPKEFENFDNEVPSPTEMDRFRWRFDSAASMIFHTKTGLPLTSSPAPLKRGSNCFDYDDSINGISGIKSALFHPVSPTPGEGWVTPRSPASPCPPLTKILTKPPSADPEPLDRSLNRPRRGPSAGLLGSFEESALKGRLEPVATVHGFTAEIGASGAFCPPHKKLPVTVFFYAPGETNAPYMGHINLGPGGYRVARSGTVQVSLFNPHGTLVKMFVVLYDLTAMPASAKTFLRQRTLYMPVGVTDPPPPRSSYKWLRYLIHLRFLTSKSGKLYLHTDIRIIVSRKSDLDTATAHSAILKAISTNKNSETASTSSSTNREQDTPSTTNQSEVSTNREAIKVNRVYGGCSDVVDYNFCSSKSDQLFLDGKKMNRSLGCMKLSNHNAKGDADMGRLSYELRSFTYGPENPKYSPR